jgi:hypothetical protein
MAFVELLENTLERQRLTCLLQSLNEIGCSDEEDPEAVLDQGVTQGRGEMRLAGAVRAEQLVATGLN